MLTPKYLYNYYTENPCTDDYSGGSIGNGTPYSLYELSVFLKQLKNPCLKNVPGYSELLSGTGVLALPFKYLEVLDPYCFSEIQPSIMAGTAHAIRNAVDVSRACSLVTLDNSQNLYSNLPLSSASRWISRGATEYITKLAGNSIAKCLFVLAPDLVSLEEATQRGTGCDSMDCLPLWKSDKPGSALGAGFSCAPDPDSDDPNSKICTPCRKCEKDDNGVPKDPSDPCCDASSCADRINFCCGDPPGRSDFFNFNANNITFPLSSLNYEYFPSGRVVDAYPPDPDKTIIHLGYLLRKQYKGYANLLDCSTELNSCPLDLFVKYMQTKNGYNYINNKNIEVSSDGIQRVKTISYVNNVNDIKKLLYHGYAVVLMTNIGFSDIRDSVGISYPDKIWYHTYAIVGYDDTKTDSDQCLFVFANSWGDWNSGGHPSWGKLPVGCFMVTEAHLSKMLTLERIDKKGCREDISLSSQTVADFWFEETQKACITDNNCIPWECDKNQTPMGYAFVVSFDSTLVPKQFDYDKFIKISNLYPPGKIQLANKPSEATSLDEFFDDYGDNLVKLNDINISKVPRNNNSLYSVNGSAVSLLNYLGYNTSPSGILEKYRTSQMPIDFNVAGNSGEFDVDKQKMILYLALNEPQPGYNSKFYHTKLYSKTSNHSLDESTTVNTLELNNLQVNDGIKFNNISTNIFESNGGILSGPDDSEYKEKSIDCNIAYLNDTIINRITLNSSVISHLNSSTINSGTVINSDALIQNSTLQFGSLVNGDAYLKNSTVISGSIIDGDVVLNNSINRGSIMGNAYLRINSTNYGLIVGNAYIWKNSLNSGIVLGSIITYDYI